ncbi:hypothetical protein [Alicyclobacillus shizuokensis]|uniref:hypothetical protein n=1 Tax=Alicyclobacillus shizuokensis TaxID=392014 RepID=UPI00082E450D|nr:hypothetical protein [Alicyclobacillus shizuokensis]
MELVEQYLESVQKVQGLYVLSLDIEDVATAHHIAEQIRERWKQMTSEPLLVLPKGAKLEYLELTSTAG